MSKQWLIIADELSSDSVAAALAVLIREKDPALTLHAFGGPELSSVVHYCPQMITKSHAFGMWERFLKRRQYRQFYRQLKRYCEAHNFEKVILVDCAYSYTDIVPILQEKSLSIDWVICPHVWMWNNHKKAAIITDAATRLFCIFPKEYDYFSDRHPRTFYFGHPVMSLDAIDCRKSERSRHAAQLEKLKRPPKKVTTVAICPGSRPQEIKALLPDMLRGFQLFQSKQMAKAFILVDSLEAERISQKILDESGVLDCHLYQASKESLFVQSDCAISATGTLTLALAVWMLPTLVLAKVSLPTYLILKYIIRFKLSFFALPNILSGTAIFPELIQHFTPQDIERELWDLSHDGVSNTAKDALAPLMDSLRVEDDPYDAIARKLLASD